MKTLIDHISWILPIQEVLFQIAEVPFNPRLLGRHDDYSFRKDVWNVVFRVLGVMAVESQIVVCVGFFV